MTKCFIPTAVDDINLRFIVVDSEEHHIATDSSKAKLTRNTFQLQIVRNLHTQIWTHATYTNNESDRESEWERVFGKENYCIVEEEKGRERTKD